MSDERDTVTFSPDEIAEIVGCLDRAMESIDAITKLLEGDETPPGD